MHFVYYLYLFQCITIHLNIYFNSHNPFFFYVMEFELSIDFLGLSFLGRVGLELFYVKMREIKVEIVFKIASYPNPK